MPKEYEPAAWTKETEPPQTDMGFSKIDYGEQRMGSGVKGSEDDDYVTPGEEGAMAVKLQEGNGGIGGRQSFDNPMKATPTGE